MRQTENKVKIEGILSEIDLNYGSFVKNGNTIETIGGTIKVKVEQKINNENTILEIPVHLFSGKLTNKGASNPAYESIERVKTSFISIAAGGEDAADRIRITNGAIQMNEYYNQNGQLVSFPRISASFITKVKKEEFKPEATFVAELVVDSKGMEVDKDGIETGRYKVKGILAQYGGKIDIVEFISNNKGVINGIDQYWNVGDTVKASGRLNFTSTTETVIQEVDFGEPIESQRTISVSELIVTGGSQTPMDGEFAINKDEIETAKAERLAKLEAQKTKDMAKASTRQAPAPANATSNGSNDLGF
jgi:hypothetical protein